MSGPVRRDQREPRLALEIVHAQYHQALRRGASADPAERAAGRAEARRLVGVTVSLRTDARARDAGPTATAGAHLHRDEPTLGSNNTRPVVPNLMSA